MIKEAIAFIKERNEERKKIRSVLVTSDCLNKKGWMLRILYFLLDIPAALLFIVAWIIGGLSNVLDDIASWITYVIYYCFIEEKNKEGGNTNGDNTESN